MSPVRPERSRRARALVAAAALAAAAIALSLAPGPTAVWRHGGIGAGRAGITFESANQLRDFSRRRQRSIEWEGDGVESTVALGFEPAGYAFLVNGTGARVPTRPRR
jgi:hypothetical protein